MPILILTVQAVAPQCILYPLPILTEAGFSKDSRKIKHVHTLSISIKYHNLTRPCAVVYIYLELLVIVKQKPALSAWIMEEHQLTLWLLVILKTLAQSHIIKEPQP